MLTRRFTTGDILAEDTEALVSPVNCVGVMGRGIALQLKKAFPENFRPYAKACQRGEVKPGAMFVFQTGMLANRQAIINFPTKRHWRGNSHIGAIDAGLKDLVHVARAHGSRSLPCHPSIAASVALIGALCAPALKRRSRASRALVWLSLNPGLRQAPRGQSAALGRRR